MTTKTQNSVNWRNPESAAKALANNHATFESFWWDNKPVDSHLWAIVYTHNRDSGLLAQSNAAAIGKALDPFLGSIDDGADCQSESHSHWACGWIAGYAIRVYSVNGEITEVFGVYCDLRVRLDDYPILDDTDYSSMEVESAMDSIEDVIHWVTLEFDDPPDLPQGIAESVYSWLADNRDSELDNRDGNGAYPSEESVLQALIALGHVQGAEHDA